MQLTPGKFKTLVNKFMGINRLYGLLFVTLYVLDTVLISDMTAEEYRLSSSSLSPPSSIQNCAIYIAMQRYRPISVILSDIVTVRIRHGLTILGL